MDASTPHLGVGNDQCLLHFAQQTVSKFQEKRRKRRDLFLRGEGNRRLYLEKEKIYFYAQEKSNADGKGGKYLEKENIFLWR